MCMCRGKGGPQLRNLSVRALWMTVFPSSISCIFFVIFWFMVLISNLFQLPFQMPALLPQFLPCRFNTTYSFLQSVLMFHSLSTVSEDVPVDFISFRAFQFFHALTDSELTLSPGSKVVREGVIVLIYDTSLDLL